jgi:hypothetical protein
MKDDTSENSLIGWFSTYGLLTAKRIFEGYKIYINDEEIISLLKNPENFYNRLLQIPLKNVYNGIILAQSYDYQVFIEKLFVDYLLSGENGKGSESPGNTIREQIEGLRKNFISMGDNFHRIELEHEKLVSASQASLIEQAKNWQNQIDEMIEKLIRMEDLKDMDPSIMKRAITHLLVHHSKKVENWENVESVLNKKFSDSAKKIIQEAISDLDKYVKESELNLKSYKTRAEDLCEVIKEFRSNFSNHILQLRNLLRALPDYSYKETQDSKEMLLFDAKLGEKFKNR